MVQIADTRGWVVRLMASGLVLATLGLTAGPASAASPWSPPAAFPLTPSFPAGWGDLSPQAAVTSEDVVLGAGRSLTPLLPSGGLGVPVTGPARRVWYLQIAGYARTRLLAVGMTTNARGWLTASSRPAVAYGTSDGRLGPPVPLDRAGAQLAGGPVNDRRLAAVNASGRAAVLTVRTTPTRRLAMRQLVLHVRPAGGAFRSVLSVDRSMLLGDSAVAINGAGDVLVAWRRGTSLYARIRTAEGRLGATRRLGPTEASNAPSHVSAAIDSSRRALVGWIGQRTNTTGRISPITIAFAYAPPHSGFQPRRVIESVPLGARPPALSPTLEVALVRGRGIVAWTGAASGQSVVKVADVVGGTMRNRQTLEGPRVPAPSGGQNASFSDLAVGPGGGVVVVWVSRSGVRAGVRGPADAAFGAMEAIASEPSPSTVVVDPVSKRPIATWLGTDGAGRLRAQYALRSPIEPR